MPAPEALPGVVAALTWLFALPFGSGDAALAMARETGLLIESAGESWKIDSDRLRQLADAGWPRLPDGDADLGVLAHGLGDLNARCHAQLFEPLCAALRAREDRVQLDRLLAAAMALELLPNEPINLEAIGMAQWLTRAEPSWETFKQAISRRERGDRFALGHRYGLAFVARAVLVLDARGADTCIAAYPDHFALAAVAGAAVGLASPMHGNRFAVALLRSATPAIRYLGAAVLICPFEHLTRSLEFEACRAALLEANVATHEATFLIGMRARLALQARNRLQGRGEETARRIQQLERDPDLAFGGRANADAELKRTRRDHAKARADAVTASATLEDVLAAWAASWPADGMLDADMEAIDEGLAKDAVLRHRLAVLLPDARNRDWLANRNIKALRSELGLDRDPKRLSRDQFFLDEKRFANLAQGTAASLFLLAGEDASVAARRCSTLIQALTQEATALLRRPYAAARMPERFQSVMTRATFACRFALVVAESAPAERRTAVAKLDRLAIDYARTLLACRDQVYNAGETFLRLAGAAVHGIARLPDPLAAYETWAFDDDLPTFPRALAMWFAPTLAIAHRELARELFRRCGEPPLSRYDDNVRVTELLHVLDAAIAVSAHAGEHGLVDDIVRLWPEAFRPWRDVAPRWADAATKLAAAVSGSGPARDTLFADPSWASSYCRQMLT